MSFDSSARSRDLCVAADAAVLKGDLKLAQRLFVQADVDDPRNPYPEERLNWLDREIERFEALKPSAKSEGRKFDFLYAPTLRGLSTELSSLLPLHPDVFSVPKTELDHAMEGGSESALLAKYQNEILNGREHLRAGLVQHAFIANQLAGPQVAARLAGVTTRKLFIHGVRDPVSLVISDFNHELVARHCGSYLFWPVDPMTPFCRVGYTLGDLSTYRQRRTLPRRAFNWLKGPRFLLDPKHIEERLEEALSRPRHFAVGHTYAQHFEAWVPINLERSLPPKRHVVSRVFDAMGVNPDFDHPAFRVSEGTTVHRLMVQNWIALDAHGQTVYVGLGYAGRMMFSNTHPHSEMLPFEPDARFADLGLSAHAFCVTIQRDQWRLLPRDRRIKLVESDELLKFRDSILVPAWLDSYYYWRAAMARYLKRELEPDVLSRLRACIGADLEKFLGRHPSFESCWSSNSALIGV